MKAGELFSIAEQQLPGVTKRLFTKFYNMYVDQLSQLCRISVVREEFSDDSYKDIMPNVVRIEDISSNTRYRWEIVNGDLLLYDNDDSVVDVPDGLVISYWKRVTSPLKTVEETLLSTNEIDITSSGAGVSPGVYDNAVLVENDYVDKQLITKQTLYYGTTPIMIPGTVYSIAKTPMSITKYDNNMNILSTVALNTLTQYVVTPVTIKATLLSKTWEEQDGGLSEDVQLCCTYQALSIITDFVGASNEQRMFLSGRAKQMEKAVRIYYNTTKHTSGSFKQVSF